MGGKGFIPTTGKTEHKETKQSANRYGYQIFWVGEAVIENLKEVWIGWLRLVLLSGQNL